MLKKILFVTDPWKTLDHANDTTLRMMHEFDSKGALVFWCDLSCLVRTPSEVLVRVQRYKNGRRRTAHRLRPSVFSQIHYRVDPPIESSYIAGLQTLAESAKPGSIVNPPELLLMHSEKTLASILGLGHLAPKTWVLSTASELAPLFRQNRTLVIKPLYSAQSKGVHLLNQKNHLKIFKQISQNETRAVVIQEFLPLVQKNGETRLWFVDGNLIGYCQKHAKNGDFKIDMDHGGSASAVTLNQLQKKTATQIGRALRKYRIRLAAVDLIQKKSSYVITDFNITSPGLLTTIEKIMGENLAAIIAQTLLRR